MNTFKLTLIATAAFALVTSGPLAVAQAQTMAVADGAVANHGDWTLKQREDWLSSSMDKARDDGDLDRHEFDRISGDLSDIHASEDGLRASHEGHQLTDNETAQLEARLDIVANHIHWARENSFRKPW